MNSILPSFRDFLIKNTFFRRFLIGLFISVGLLPLKAYILRVMHYYITGEALLTYIVLIPWGIFCVCPQTNKDDFWWPLKMSIAWTLSNLMADVVMNTMIDNGFNRWVVLIPIATMGLIGYIRIKRRT